MAVQNYQRVVVIDNGSYLMKVGFAGEDVPKSIFRTGANRLKKNRNDTSHAAENSANASLTYPIQRGIITDWDCMEDIWRQAFHEQLRLIPQDHPVLLAERPFHPEVKRQRACEIMFETFKTPALCLAIQGVLTLYSSGRTTGVAVDSGDELTQIVPTHEGNALQSTILIDDSLAGLDITQYLGKLLAERGINFNFDNADDRDILRSIKETLCYVCTDDFVTHSRLTPKDLEKTYELPDGRKITVDHQRTQCPEALFKPALLGTDAFGISETCYNSIQRCEFDLGAIMYGNIVLTGGNTLFPGFPERMKSELQEMMPLTVKDVNVESLSERQYGAWRGGAILASMSSFQNMLISKQEYEEHGFSIVNKKCY